MDKNMIEFRTVCLKSVLGLKTFAWNTKCTIYQNQECSKLWTSILFYFLGPKPLHGGEGSTEDWKKKKKTMAIFWTTHMMALLDIYCAGSARNSSWCIELDKTGKDILSEKVENEHSYLRKANRLLILWKEFKSLRWLNME